LSSYIGGNLGIRVHIRLDSFDKLDVYDIYYNWVLIGLGFQIESSTQDHDGSSSSLGFQIRFMTENI
jgi:hypothetical protein